MLNKINVKARSADGAHSLPLLQRVSLVGGITALGAGGLLQSQYTTWQERRY